MERLADCLRWDDSNNSAVATKEDVCAVFINSLQLPVNNDAPLPVFSVLLEMISGGTDQCTQGRTLDMLGALLMAGGNTGKEVVLWFKMMSGKDSTTTTFLL